jgi:hypothetical protein
LVANRADLIKPYRPKTGSQGTLSNLGHELARSTIAQILERHGIEPAPERIRKTTWKDFLASAGIKPAWSSE